MVGHRLRERAEFGLAGGERGFGIRAFNDEPHALGDFFHEGDFVCDPQSGHAIVEIDDRPQASAPKEGNDKDRARVHTGGGLACLRLVAERVLQEVANGHGLAGA